MKEAISWGFIFVAISLLTIACAKPKDSLQQVREQIVNNAQLKELKAINDSLRQENAILKSQLGIYE